MKVKNIVFSGFAAAILMGSVDANAAFQIASKAYVDSLSKIEVGGVETPIKDIVEGLNSGDNSVASQIEDAIGTLPTGANDVGEALADINSEIGNTALGTNAETITGAIAELDGKVDTLTGNASTVGSVAHAEASAAAAQADADALEGIVGNTALSTTNQTVTSAINELNSGKVNVSDKATTIRAQGTADDAHWATEAAVRTALNNITGGGATIGVLNDGNGGTYNSVADALADKADKSVIAGTNETLDNSFTATTLVGAINELNTEKQDALTPTQLNAVNSGVTSGKVANYDSIYTLLTTGFAECVAQATNPSEHCVLTVAAGDTMPSWVAVTDPWVEE